jgi:hypothetical protein
MQQVLFFLSVFSGGQHHDVAHRAVAGSFKKGSLFTAETGRIGFQDPPPDLPPEVLAPSERIIIGLPMLVNCPNMHRVLCLSKIGKKKFFDVWTCFCTPAGRLGCNGENHFQLQLLDV